MRKKFFRKLSAVVTATAILITGFPQIGLNSLNASTTNKNTEVKPVEIDEGAFVSDMGKFKDMDTSFLKDFDYGNAYEALITFSNVESLESSTFSNLTEGVIVKTRGYYSVGDGGAACYEISKKAKDGAVTLKNGLYANFLPEKYTDAEGKVWAVASVKQFGAKGDSENADDSAINHAIKLIGSYSSDLENEYYRGLVFVPAGEYKITDMIRAGQTNLNMVGEGESSILFTDNDYRKTQGYSEFLFEVWGGKNEYFGDFVIEGREVDLYHYMRQFVLVYSENVYIKNVDMLIPESAYSSYYFEDKQYSNFCCYTGNKDITADGCKMVQMSGTYRGANVGVLDIWSSGERNITVMNCELYGNARDEQIGFFSTDKDSAFLENIDFVNNTIHAYEPKYTEVVGNATMRFTVAYNDSKNINDIHIAGNHFIVECDSKFMTFGKMTNCVIENNIFEVKCTYATWSMIFDSGNSDPANILIQNNEFYLSSDEGFGKGNFVGGNLTLKNNRIFSAVPLYFGILGPVTEENEITLLRGCGFLSSNGDFNRNTLHIYGKMVGEGITGNGEQYANYTSGKHSFSGNTIYNYNYDDDMQLFKSVFILNGDVESLEISDNKFYYPNTRMTKAGSGGLNSETDESGKHYVNSFFRVRSGNYGSVIVKNNEMQGVKIPETNEEKNILCENNTYIPSPLTLSVSLTSKINVLHNGNPLLDEDGNPVTEEIKADNKSIRWVSAVNSIAEVTEDGVVTRKMNGDAHIYALATDGATVYGKCTIHFEKEKAADILLDTEEVVLQPGLKKYIDYNVVPPAASQEVEFVSENTEIATVLPKGIITAKAVGETNILCSTPDGTIAKKVHVVVSDVSVKKITMKDSYKYIEYNQRENTYQAEVQTYYPDDAANKAVGSWKSSNEEIATVSDTGLVTIKGTGVVSIYAYSTDESCHGTTVLYIQNGAVGNLGISKVTSTSVTLTWDEVDHTYGYYIYKWNDESSTWEECRGNTTYGNITGTSFTVNGLTPGKEYKFKVCPFISRWTSNSRIVYYGVESEISATTTVTTLSMLYSDNNSKYYRIFKNQDPVSSKVFMRVNYTGEDTYEDLDFSYEFENPDIAEIDSIDSSTSGSFQIYMKGLKPGMTTLKVTANKGTKASIEIPVGVLTGESVRDSNIIYEPSFRNLHIKFKGLEDESSINGYIFRRRVSYHYEDYVYIEKNDTGEYELDTSEFLKDGTSDRYVITPYMFDGKNYYLGSNSPERTIEIPPLYEVEKIDLQPDVYKMIEGDTKEITATATREDGVDVSINKMEWFTLNEEIAKVVSDDTVYEANKDQAKLSACVPGITKVQVMAKDGSRVMASQSVIVFPKGEIESVSGKCSSTNILLTWKGKEELDGYHVYRYDKNEWKQIADVSDCSYEDKDLCTKTEYQYKIAGYMIADEKPYEGVYSDEKRFTTLDTAQETTGEEEITVGSYKYKITGKKTVCLTGTKKKTMKSAIIKETVKIKGKTYKITGIGKNVKTIGSHKVPVGSVNGILKKVYERILVSIMRN